VTPSTAKTIEPVSIGAENHAAVRASSSGPPRVCSVSFALLSVLAPPPGAAS